MQTKTIKTCAAWFAAAVFTLAGCAVPLQEKPRTADLSGGLGAVRISLARGAARTIMPQADLDTLYLEYWFARDGAAAVEKTPEDGIFTLEPGSYGLTVRAFAGGSGGLAAEGSTEEDFVIAAGIDPGTVSVVLRPLANEGEGSLEYALRYPAGAAVEILTLTRIAGGESFNLLEGAAVSGADPVVLSGSKTGIPAGYYLLRTLLKNSEGLYAGKSEAAHVYRNLTARTGLADYTFTAEDFNGALTAVKIIDYAAYDSDQQFSAALRELLDYLPNGNTPGNPVALKVQGLDVSTKLSVLTDALTRYASLDLSECSASIQDGYSMINGPWVRIDIKESKWVTDLVLPAAVANLTFQSLPSVIHFNAYSNLRSFAAPGVTKMGSSVFSGCANLERVELPAMRVIWAEANFSDCPSLTTVIIPSVEIIGERTFKNDTALETIEVGQLTSIRREAFDGANPDFDFIVSGAMTWDPATRQLSGVDGDEVTLLAWLREDRSPADIPANITKIGDCLFYGMTNITTLDLPATITVIGDRAFFGCSALAQASMPGVKRVGEYAFFETALVAVELPEATYVSGGAFSTCLQLESVKLPKVVEIGPGMVFSNAGKLTSVDLGDSLETIGSQAFSSCPKLESLTLPGTVTYIGYYAFAQDCGIKTLTVNAVTPPVVEYYYKLYKLFGGISYYTGEPYPYPLESIYVPAESVDAYKSAPEWDFYAKHIKPIK